MTFKTVITWMTDAYKIGHDNEGYMWLELAQRTWPEEYDFWCVSNVEP